MSIALSWVRPKKKWRHGRLINCRLSNYWCNSGADRMDETAKPDTLDKISWLGVPNVLSVGCLTPPCTVWTLWIDVYTPPRAIVDQAVEGSIPFSQPRRMRPLTGEALRSLIGQGISIHEFYSIRTVNPAHLLE